MIPAPDLLASPLSTGDVERFVKTLLQGTILTKKIRSVATATHGLEIRLTDDRRFRVRIEEMGP